MTDDYLIEVWEFWEVATACKHRGLTYIHTDIHTYMHTCMHAHIHTYISACMHACKYAYIHKYWGVVSASTHQGLTRIYAITCKHTYILRGRRQQTPQNLSEKVSALVSFLHMISIVLTFQNGVCVCVCVCLLSSRFCQQIQKPSCHLAGTHSEKSAL